MYVIGILCFSTGTLTTFAYDYFVRTGYGDQSDFAIDYAYAIYIW
jgi:hypothetical protein